ncbi:MAG TPA: inositol monophosphatase family protein [candidate division Zixibacteria bacterium]|nr:inositol monophosphatase family protein [candidate division Zixibacteria bacterium]
MTGMVASFLSAAWDAARAAGELLRESWLKPQTIDYKGAIDLVTAADRESERCIVAALRERFPDHAILAEEESNVTGSGSGYRWIVDPLDGTTNFAHGYPHFCVSIALEHESELIVGLVYDPLRRECFRAAKGHGATLNGSTIRISSTPELDKSLLATGFPYDRREHPDFYLAYFKAFMVRSQGVRRDGSAALDLCYVACGRLDGFWEMKLQPWDTAAGSLIVTEAGGRISDFSGGRFSLWGSETLASNGTIHDEMVAVASTVSGSVPPGWRVAR